VIRTMTYHFASQENFLGLDEESSALESASVLVLPIPYEATVSYAGGTKNGPRAILNASMQVELFDREFDREYGAEYGVHTLAPLATNHQSPEAMVQGIEEAVREIAATHPKKLLFVLGGEHTITSGVAKGVATALEAQRPVLVQLDAHSDLRDEYEGSPYSHASISRRLVDAGWEVLQVGIRSICQEEMDVIRSNTEAVKVWFADDLHDDPQWKQELAQRVRGRDVFLTIDIDGLDPSLVPGTGTPEPNGLTWQEAVSAVRIVTQYAGRILGADCVELAPIPGNHASEFITAKLIYKTMNLIMAARQKQGA
jgi:agmatinase